jgi:hypothetical protein
MSSYSTCLKSDPRKHHLCATLISVSLLTVSEYGLATSTCLLTDESAKICLVRVMPLLAEGGIAAVESSKCMELGLLYEVWHFFVPGLTSEPNSV